MQAQVIGPAEQAPVLGRGHFFAIDRRTWNRVSTLGINAAVAYLILARGTGRDQRTTSWSVDAIERKTGISRPRAKAAVAALIEAKAVHRLKAGARPQYYIAPAHEVPGSEAAPVTLSMAQASVLATLAEEGTYVAPNKGSSAATGWQPPNRLAQELVTLGRARLLKTNTFAPVPYDPEAAATPDWIWLPNAIIDGAVGERPPVELVRQTQSVGTLRLFVSLYHASNLATDGGVHWRVIRQTYVRLVWGRPDGWTVWHFTPDTELAWGDKPIVVPFLTGELETVTTADGGTTKRDKGWPAFWAAWKLLKQLGLVEIVPHLVEADSDEANVIHPLPCKELGAPGLDVENRLAEATHAAGCRLMCKDPADFPYTIVAPVPAHMTEVQLFGIARPKYRARTTATAAWAERGQDWEDAIEQYELLAPADAAAEERRRA